MVQELESGPTTVCPIFLSTAFGKGYKYRPYVIRYEP
jgi:hypothetical protein